MKQLPPADRSPTFVTRLMDDVEPALLDFIKTNVNSFIKWDLLKLFAANWDTLDSAENIARYVGRTVAVIEQELEDLVESCFCQTKPAALINRKEQHRKGLLLYFYN